ncbi:MAG: ROK family protein [Rhizobiales bacterium]|nr:ROK family protein [Hyphomicrobiales bacterium]
MPSDTKAPPPLIAHGSDHLPAVTVDSYNLEIKDNGGFLGDRANKRAFVDILDELRKPLAKLKSDPFGDTPTEDLSKKTIDAAMTSDEPDAVGLVQGAVEAFAQEFAYVIRNTLKTKEWKKTQRIVIGGGMRESRYGELCIARAGVLLKGDEIDVQLAPIRNHPDDAGLIGAVHLAPSWIFGGHDSIVAVDIGGTNMRAGIVELNLKKADDFSKAAVWKRELWRHADDKPKRDEAVAELVKMIGKLIGMAEKEGFKLAPFIGIGCPGRIDNDGSIERGAQNLPGNWESSRFNLPNCLTEEIARIGDHETVVVMHNDAVVQGLSEVPFMRDVEHWGVLTIGTGLGNARFTNRELDDDKAARQSAKKASKKD